MMIFILNFAKSFIIKHATEKLLENYFIEIAEFIAKKTTNTLDDKLVAILKEQMNEK
jgi:hypothetical protein